MSLRACQPDVAQHAVVEPRQLPFASAPARLAPQRIDHMVMEEAGETGEESVQRPIAGTAVDCS